MIQSRCSLNLAHECLTTVAPSCLATLCTFKKVNQSTLGFQSSISFRGDNLIKVMFPITKPSAESMAMTHCNNNSAFHWTDAIVASAVESMRHPKVGGSWTITPLKRTGRNNNFTFPSQELRDEEYNASASYSDTYLNPLAISHPLPDFVDSVATYEEDARKRRVDEMASIATTVKNEQLDSFKLVMDCNITAAQHDIEVRDARFRSEGIASKHTTSPGATKVTSSRTVVKSSRRRLVVHATKAGVAKSRPKTTVVVPYELDILRGESHYNA